jgi:hypothetical protein
MTTNNIIVITLITASVVAWPCVISLNEYVKNCGGKILFAVN